MSPEPLPLAAAAIRLRGRPGRPRKGTAGAQASDATRANSGSDGGGQDSSSGRPFRQRAPIDQRRLLGVNETADYLSISTDTVRELATSRLSPARVEIPGNARVLFDRQVIDQLVAGWRTPA